MTFYRLTLPALALALAASLAAPAAAQEETERTESDSFIEVAGSATASRPADGAVLRASLLSRAETRIEANAAFAELNERLESGAVQLGSADRVSVSSSGLRTAVQRPPNCTGRRLTRRPEACAPVAFSVSAQLNVTVRPAEAAGDLASWLNENGAEDVRLERWFVEDPVELENDALRLAVGEALIRAEAVAEASGLRLGGIRMVTDQERHEIRPGGFPPVIINDRERDPFAPSTRPEVGISLSPPDIKRTGNVRIEVETLPAGD